MSQSFKDIATKHYKAILFLSTSATQVLIYIIGVGRYRCVLVFAIFFFLRAFLVNTKIGSELLKFLLFPFLLLSLYLDIQHGQINPVFPRLHFMTSLLALIVSERIIVGGVKIALRDLSGNKLFTICTRCHHSNKGIVEQCTNCSHRFSQQTEQNADSDHVDNLDRDVSTEIARNKSAGLFRTVHSRLLNMLDLSIDESILMNMNAFAFIWFSKDGVTKYGLNLLLTNKRMIFIDYSLFGGSGWHLRENIFYDDIISLSAAKHVLGINEKPTLFITTTQHSYEIGFFHILPDSEIVQINKVLAIIDCIKKRNPHIETQVTFQNKLKDMFFMWR